LKRAWLVAGLVSASWGLLACEETTPTSGNGTLIPLEPQTVALDLSFEEFAEAVTVYGGYGTPSELFEAVLAQDYEGVLDARVLVRYAQFPWAASVRDSTGTTRADSAYTFVGGRLVARFDTTEANRPEGAVVVRAGVLPQEFDARTASWAVAVDTLADRQPWGEAGAGPAVSLGEAEWDPASGDSVVLELDSAMVAMLGDTLQAGPGVRYEVLTAGVRMNLLSSDLRLYARPNIHQDTIVTLNAPPLAQTFIYDPFPEPAQDGIRVGGAPSWRTVMTFDVPTQLPGTPAICQRVQCPITLTPGRLNNATLTLTTAPSEAAFQPADSVFLDARAVLAPELLPKSPLGTSLVGAPGVPIGPDGFGDVAGQTVTIPVTTFVRALFDESGEKVPDLVLLTPLEPLSIGFGTFVGPGQPGAPRLRLILTVSDTVEIS
jgi:hypothetical protein